MNQIRHHSNSKLFGSSDSSIAQVDKIYSILLDKDWALTVFFWQNVIDYPTDHRATFC